jgi:hypothetical protein
VRPPTSCRAVSDARSHALRGSSCPAST